MPSYPPPSQLLKAILQDHVQKTYDEKRDVLRGYLKELLYTASLEGIQSGAIMDSTVEHDIDTELAQAARIPPNAKLPITDHKHIATILAAMSIGDFTIQRDGKVDCIGDVYIDQTGVVTRKRTTRLALKFGVVRNFNIRHLNLTTLEGCPSEVIGEFEVSGNSLRNLKYAPTKVGSYTLDPTTHKHTPNHLSMGFDHEVTSWEEVLRYDWYMTTHPKLVLKTTPYPEVINHITELTRGSTNPAIEKRLQAYAKAQIQYASRHQLGAA